MSAKFTRFLGGSLDPSYVDREIIRLTREGIWLADGLEITHAPTRDLFARSLAKDEAGYFLHIGFEMKRIEVEDTAYFVTQISGNSQDGFELTLNDQTKERLNAKTLRYQPGRLTCTIKNQEGSPEVAKFLRNPYWELLQNAQDIDGKFYLRIEGEWIGLGE